MTGILRLGRPPTRLVVHLARESRFFHTFQLAPPETWPAAPTLVFSRTGTVPIVWTATVSIDGADADFEASPAEVDAVIAANPTQVQWVVGDTVYASGQVIVHA